VCRVKPRGSGSPTRCGAETGDADGGALSLPVTLMALATAWRANQENTHPLLHHGAAPLLGFVAGEMDGRDPHPRVPERRPGAPAWSPDWSRIGHRIRGMRCHAVGQLRAMSSRFPWSDVVSWDGALWAETRYVLLESVLGFTALGGSNPPPSATGTPSDLRRRPGPVGRGVRVEGPCGPRSVQSGHRIARAAVADRYPGRVPATVCASGPLTMTVEEAGRLLGISRGRRLPRRRLRTDRSPPSAPAAGCSSRPPACTSSSALTNPGDAVGGAEGAWADGAER
jgi:hypothetical protein